MNQTEVVSGYLSAAGLESWVLQVFMVILATALLAFGTRRFVARLHAALGRTASVWDDSFVESIGPPLRAFIWIAGIAFAVEIIQNEAGATIFEAVTPIRDVGVVAAVAWFGGNAAAISAGVQVKNQPSSSSPSGRGLSASVAE